MTLLFVEGFDSLDATNLLGRWDANFTSMTTGRFGAQCARTTSATGHAHMIGSNVTSFVCGFAYKKPSSNGLSSSGIDIIQFKDGSSKQIELRINDSWKLILTRNGTALATSTLSINVNTWHYIEVKATIADSGGTAIVRVDGVEFINYTGDTKNTANAYITNILITCGSNGNEVMFDDIYFQNQSGSVNNDFLGDSRIITLKPNGAGASTQWTPSANSNYQNVDDTTSDGDSTYNYSGTVGQIDTFAMEDISGSGTIKGIAINLVARKDDASARQVSPITRVGSTNYEGSAHTMAATYVMYQSIRETNPATASAWLVSEVNAAEIGYKMVA